MHGGTIRVGHFGADDVGVATERASTKAAQFRQWEAHTSKCETRLTTPLALFYICAAKWHRGKGTETVRSFIYGDSSLLEESG